MANVVVEEQSLIDIASAIRTKNETDNTYKPSEMANAILDITTSEDLSSELNTQETLLDNQTSKISNAINLLQGKATGGSGSDTLSTCTVMLDSKYDDFLNVAAIVVTIYNETTKKTEPYIINDSTKDVTIKNVVCDSFIYFINVSNIHSWTTGPNGAWYCYDGTDYVLTDSTNLNAVFRTPTEGGATGTIRFTVA